MRLCVFRLLSGGVTPSLKELHLTRLGSNQLCNHNQRLLHKHNHDNCPDTGRKRPPVSLQLVSAWFYLSNPCQRDSDFPRRLSSHMSRCQTDTASSSSSLLPPHASLRPDSSNHNYSAAAPRATFATHTHTRRLRTCFKRSVPCICFKAATNKRDSCSAWLCPHSVGAPLTWRHAVSPRRS